MDSTENEALMEKLKCWHDLSSSADLKRLQTFRAELFGCYEQNKILAAVVELLGDAVPEDPQTWAPLLAMVGEVDVEVA